MKKKLLSLFLALCMILSTCVTMAVTTFATEASTPTAADGGLTPDELAAADTAGEGTININGSNDWDKFVTAAATLDFDGVTIKLNADITYNSDMVATEMNLEDVATRTVWSSIPCFSGTFDGGNHTISGLCTTENGFISTLMGGATIKNVTFSNMYVYDQEAAVWAAGGVAGAAAANSDKAITLENVTVSNSAIISGQSAVGALIGKVDENVPVQVLSCRNESTIVYNYQTNGNSYARAGGLIGYAYSSVSFSNCVNTGDIYSTAGTAKAFYHCAGGLIGFMSDGAIEDSTNYGDIKAGDENGGLVGSVYAPGTVFTISNSFNYGDVTSTYYAGGILGYGQISLVDAENVMNAGDISSTSYIVGGLVGRIKGGGFKGINVANTGNVSSSAEAAGFVGEIPANVTLTFENAINTGNVTSTGGPVAGFVAITQSNFSIKRAVNTGTISTNGAWGAYGGFVGHSRTTEGYFEECISTGAVKGIYSYWGAAFAAEVQADVTAEQFYTFKDCYYVKGIVQSAEGVSRDTNPVIASDQPGKVNVRAEYTAKEVTQSIIGNAANADELMTALNACFTDGTTGAMLDNVAALSGAVGVAFLQSVGYDFASDWSVSAGVPVPTTLVLRKGAPDTAYVAYKGYQTKIETESNTETVSIRLVAGLDSLEYINTGYELFIIEANRVLNLEAKTTTTVYGELNTYDASGTLSDPVTASSCGCTYLSAITINDIPKTDSAISLVMKPFVTNADGSVAYGTMIVLEIVNGAVVSQRTL